VAKRFAAEARSYNEGCELFDCVGPALAGNNDTNTAKIRG